MLRDMVTCYVQKISYSLYACLRRKSRLSYFFYQNLHSQVPHLVDSSVLHVDNQSPQSRRHAAPSHSQISRLQVPLPNASPGVYWRPCLTVCAHKVYYFSPRLKFPGSRNGLGPTPQMYWGSRLNFPDSPNAMDRAPLNTGETKDI